MTPSLPDLSHMVTQRNASSIFLHYLSQGLCNCFGNLGSDNILSNGTFSQIWEKLVDVWWLWGYQRKSIKHSNMAGPHINHLSAWNLSEQEEENELGRRLRGWEIAPEELSRRKEGWKDRGGGRNDAKTAEWEEEQADWGGEWRKWKEVYGDNEGRGAECKVDVKILWVEKGSDKCSAITGRRTGAWARGRQEEEEEGEEKHGWAWT